jgi:cystathionine gamma-synthase
MSDALPDLRLETLAVITGRPEHQVDAPLNQPPVFASTYVGSHNPEHGDLGYGRYQNATWQALERAIGALEGGRALCYSSGMAAADAILGLVPRGSTVVLPTNCYLGVSSLVDERAALLDWTVERVSVSDTAAVLAAAKGADLVWIESPTNPTIDVADLPSLGDAMPQSAILVVDSTFATPLLQRPLRYGTTIVLHSATKFMSGHSDAMLGAIVVDPVRDDLYSRLLATRKLRGAVPGVMESYLVLRGLRTLALRLERAQANAAVLAKRLAAHSDVLRVRYPGLDTDPGHDVAKRTMAGFGSLVAIELADAPTADAFIDRLQLWVHATSLGGVESTLERRRRWSTELPTVPEGLIRLSVGIEHVEDLWRDLEEGLRSA